MKASCGAMYPKPCQLPKQALDPVRACHNRSNILQVVYLKAIIHNHGLKASVHIFLFSFVSKAYMQAPIINSIL